MTTTSDTGRRPEKQLGRKRNDQLTASILEATGELLLELGYDRLRIQDVADRAGAGTGAIYRRWPTKEALVAEAIRTLPDDDLPVTDDPAADLRNLIAHHAAVMHGEPDLIPGMIAAMRAEPVIDAAVRERHDVAKYRDAIARLVGEDHPGLDLLAEVAPALALHRALFSPGGLDEAVLTDELIRLAGIAGHG